MGLKLQIQLNSVIRNEKKIERCIELTEEKNATII